MKDYAIRVHGLKGNARTLGAEQLADIAFEHEKQSKADNVEYVNRHFAQLLEIWESTLEGFEKYVEEQGGGLLGGVRDGSGDSATAGMDSRSA